MKMAQLAPTLPPAGLLPSAPAFKIAFLVHTSSYLLVLFVPSRCLAV